MAKAAFSSIFKLHKINCEMAARTDVGKCGRWGMLLREGWYIVKRVKGRGGRWMFISVNGDRHAVSSKVGEVDG